MSTYIAHPENVAQENAVKAFFEALKIPFEMEQDIDETMHLLSTEANAKRLMDAIQNENKKNGMKVSLDEIWK